MIGDVVHQETRQEADAYGVPEHQSRLHGDAANVAFMFIEAFAYLKQNLPIAKPIDRCEAERRDVTREVLAD